MRVYNCKVRLAGNIQNEVPRVGVTAAEIMVLRQIHGGDAVIDIKPVREDQSLAHAAVRDYLEATYETARVQGKSVVEHLFGPAHNRLPIELPDMEGAEIQAEAPIRRARAPRAPAAEPAPDLAALAG